MSWVLRKARWSAGLLRLWGILISGQKYKGTDWLIAAGKAVTLLRTTWFSLGLQWLLVLLVVVAAANARFGFLVQAGSLQ